MSRVRISTTVDGEHLARLRKILQVKDSELLDLALALLLRQSHAQHEREALLHQPYEEDGDLAWAIPAGKPLPYDGVIPDDVLALAQARRAQRSR